MEFDNQFEVPLPPDQAWRVLMDVERIVPCMPGAQLDEKLDARSFKGKVAVRLGPVALSFAGTARFEASDDAAHRATVQASGADAKGRGGANATVSFAVEDGGAGSLVKVHTKLSLSGAVAQYGRGQGMIQEVASQLIGQFATSLRTQLQSEGAAPAIATPGTAAAPAAAKPISGFSLLWAVFRRWLRGLFAEGKTP